MAVGLRGLFKLNLGLTKAVFSKSNFLTVGLRSLYTERDLGITSYENTRFLYRNQFISIEDTFRAKMKEICQNEDGMIFTEDLKAMIHLAQSNDTDMQLVSDMLVKYLKLKAEKPISSYVFGTVVMRMCYYLNEPKFALSMFNNPEVGDTFAYQSAIRVLVCLLFKHQMYTELKEVIEQMANKKGTEFILSNSIMLYAACMKENTPESAQYAIERWREHCRIRIPSARATSMVAYLAIKHNSPEEALEMLSVVNRNNAMSIRCLKVLAYAHLGKFLSVIPLLKYSTEQEVLVPHKYGYYADVLFTLQEKLRECNSPEEEQILALIEKLKRQQRVEGERTLEEFLLRPLITMKRVNEGTGIKRETPENRVGMKGFL
ncbi:pentatricopeptide repeat-containing protein 2, mitochondrial [Megachile rotundata]|uniref:pentatricopeptide repeat-containing protein 2, mitochondrial n=1 Tax=Megachile rotundata TaxID=143995 RepID=UPI000258E1F8|nr:PREDICTED: uncharacterized protein LOC100883060 [Megachile rotundata]